jgi:hypothetical protein
VGNAQLTFVKTRAEADTLAKASGVKCYHSGQCHDENVAALRALSSGNPIIATYGLGVGVNLMSNGQAISTVDHHGQFVCACNCKLCEIVCMCVDALVCDKVWRLKCSHNLSIMNRCSLQRCLSSPINWPHSTRGEISHIRDSRGTLSQGMVCMLR